MSSDDKSGIFQLGDRHVSRLGYGAMQLAGLVCLVLRRTRGQHSPSCVRRLQAA
jgi:hypothetical protein